MRTTLDRIGSRSVSVIDCPVCGRKVNTEAIRCPECGADPRLPPEAARAEVQARNGESASRPALQGLPHPSPRWRKAHSIVTITLVAYFFSWLVLYLLGDAPHLWAVELLHLLGAYVIAALLGIVALVAAPFAIVGLVARSFRAGGRFVGFIGLVAVIGLLAFVLSLGASHLVFDGLPPSYHALDFDRTTWLEAWDTWLERKNTPLIAIRQKMLADVVDDLPGSSRAEVIRRLGPDYESLTDEEGPHLIYWVGPTLFDDEYLHIYFDASGRVTRWELWES